MTLFAPVFIVFVGVLMILFIPLTLWKRLEKHFCLEPNLGNIVNIRRFSSVYLEGFQLNGLVSIFIYEDCFVLKHISPLMKPLVFSREKVFKTNKRRAGFDIFSVSRNGKQIEIGLRKGLLGIWND